jgi:hypothetical protein
MRSPVRSRTCRSLASHDVDGASSGATFAGFHGAQRYKEEGGRSRCTTGERGLRGLERSAAGVTRLERRRVLQGHYAATAVHRFGAGNGVSPRASC